MAPMFGLFCHMLIGAILSVSTSFRHIKSIRSQNSPHRICDSRISSSSEHLALAPFHSGLSGNFNAIVKLGVLSTMVATTLISSPLIACASDAVFNEVWKIANENFFDETYNGKDWNKLRVEYQEKLDSGADEIALTKKLLQQLNDKYTRLLDKNQYESLWKYDAIGVGLLFQSDPGKSLYVPSPPITGSSAAQAGIRAGDLISSINGKSTDGITAMQILDMMSNDESRTVEIEYSHSEDPTKKQTVVLKRSTQKAENPVTYSVEPLKDGKTAGYIQLSEFNSEAVAGLRDALTKLNSKNVDVVFLDLRGNTGGGFQFALNIGGMFMNDRVMVTAVGKNHEQNTFKSSYPEGVLFKKTLVLLTDELSASASEVLAGGLHDNCRAVLAGSKTYGKGKIQAVFGLADGEGLTMTVAQYVTPKGTIIQSKGLQPDIPLSVTNAYVNLLIGGLQKPDLKSIDLDAVQKLYDSCKASVDSSQTQTVDAVNVVEKVVEKVVEREVVKGLI